MPRFHLLLTRPRTILGFKQKLFGGHPEANRSYVLSLEALGLQVRINPRSPASMNAVVISGTSDLLGKLKLYEKVLLGPNSIDNPGDLDDEALGVTHLILSTPSEWVRENWIARWPELKDRVIVWPAGSDADFWSPKSTLDRKHHTGKRLLIYIKNEASEVDSMRKDFELQGFQVRTIKYGAYTPKHYREMLRWSTAMIWLGDSESQGLALQEAWMTGVPTFVKSRASVAFQTRQAPYLNNELGSFWCDLTDLKDKLTTNYPSSQHVREASVELFSYLSSSKALRIWL